MKHTPSTLIMIVLSDTQWPTLGLLPPATQLGQGYVFTGVCDSVHRGGVPDQVHPPGPCAPPRPGTPPDQVHPLGPGEPPSLQTRYTPRPGTPPRTRYTPPDQPGTHQTRYTPPGPGTPPDQVHPPSAEHAGRYGQRAGGTHPTGMQSCWRYVYQLNRNLASKITFFA